LAAKNSRKRIEARSPATAASLGTRAEVIAATRLLMDFVPVDFKASSAQLAAEGEFPPTRRVERFLHYATKV
jgi:hypothetical protein